MEIFRWFLRQDWFWNTAELLLLAGSLWVYIVDFQKSKRESRKLGWAIITSFFLINIVMGILPVTTAPLALLRNVFANSLGSLFSIIYILAITIFTIFLGMQAAWVAIRKREWKLRPLGFLIFVTCALELYQLSLTSRMILRIFQTDFGT